MRSRPNCLRNFIARRQVANFLAVSLACPSGFRQADLCGMQPCAGILAGSFPAPCQHRPLQSRWRTAARYAKKLLHTACSFMHPGELRCHPPKLPYLQAACEAEQQGSLSESQALDHTCGGDLSRRGGVTVEASLQQVPVRASSALLLCRMMCCAVSLSMSSLARKL